MATKIGQKRKLYIEGGHYWRMSFGEGRGSTLVDFGYAPKPDGFDGIGFYIMVEDLERITKKEVI